MKTIQAIAASQRTKYFYVHSWSEIIFGLCVMLGFVSGLYGCCVFYLNQVENTSDFPVLSCLLCLLYLSIGVVTGGTIGAVLSTLQRK